MEQTYNLIINEAQRLYILKLLEADKQNVDPDDIDTAYLAGCFETLPKDEAEFPGIAHGLCL